jgi:hypothetical protein
MKDRISGEHIGLVLESLRYYKVSIENYPGCPVMNSRGSRVRDVKDSVAAASASFIVALAAGMPSRL